MMGFKTDVDNSTVTCTRTVLTLSATVYAIENPRFMNSSTTSTVFDTSRQVIE